MNKIRRRSDGSIDCEFYVAQSRVRRSEYINGALSAAGSRAVSPKAKRHIRSWAIAFVLATGGFWLTMAKDPPRSVAADPASGPTSGFSPLDIKIPSGLPFAEGGNAY